MLCSGTLIVIGTKKYLLREILCYRVSKKPEINCLNGTTLKAKSSVINNYSETIGISRDCPEQVGHLASNTPLPGHEELFCRL